MILASVFSITLNIAVLAADIAVQGYFYNNIMYHGMSRLNFAIMTNYDAYF